MDTTGLLLSAVGTVAGVVSAYFAYVAVRHQLARHRRRAAPRTPLPAPSPANGAARYDVFVSYGREDTDWVHSFAERLGEKGLNVAYDEVVSRPGGIRVHTVEAAIREAAHGVLVFSPASMSSGWVRQEYAALMQSSIESGRLFIPVVVGDVQLPEFAATRYCADFRRVGDGAGDDGVYEQRVDEIARAVRSR
ncbi:toll/interleukin-1 receptor domain-containing protein [Streptomyces sp. ISL-98]|uniref:toll/interleukin-1 receptor domain-containing protein n=1 Tax=Streptomyces sp. ISL-98 TaxID=2819192 RepID=UPI001BEB43B2|nr:toll/interleukin-1 receptor domain-containing protein [Streptomyces sp. ISL-98]MBT2511124.1 toll/interleukin-1 receptor domain-containing protein [Streptomyces sp. ISL-98]